MATTITSSTFTNTYKDDYADSDNYHRILFNSGVTLQARELTQLQTILQKQIKRFGDNVFQEGAVVNEGGLNLNTKYEFIKLNTTTYALPATPSSLVGTSFTGATSGVVAKVLEVVSASGSDPATLYVQYTSTLASPDTTAAPIRMKASETLSNGSTTLVVQTTNTVANPAVGTGARFSIGDGIYYTNGHFVFVQTQNKIISKYSDAPNVECGFKIVEDVVTTADTNALFDNQGVTPNVSAPGADRYRISLQIATRDEIDSDENFVHVANIVDGRIQSAVKAIDSYNVPNQLIAQRIFENSGDYIVDPFTIKFETDSATGFLNLKVSDGIAVVEGYRAARYTPTNIRVEKATSTTVVNNDVVSAEFGNYVFVAGVTSGAGNAKGLPNINLFELMNLRTAVAHGGSTIGTARLRGVTEDGANYKYHLFDVKMNSGQTFRDVKSIGTSVTNYFNPTLESSKAVLKETSNNSLLFALPNSRPQTMADISLAVQRRFPTTTNSSGQATITLSATGETFTNTGDWIFANADSDLMITSPTISGAGTQSASISGLPVSSSNLEILAYVNKGSGVVRTKTLTDGAITTAVDGSNNLNLGKADIFSITEVVDGVDSSISYANRFTLDNGQRDNFYALGKLNLIGGQSAPGGQVHIKFKHFTHGAAGDFFAVNSYSGQVNYADIPNHTLATGQTVSLRNVLDFRPVQDSDGAYATTSTGARVHELPQPTDLVQADITYYQAGAAKLVINTDGLLEYIEGTPGFTSRIPEKPDQSLGLYDIILGPNTLNDSDVFITRLESKRFTMADIGRLEDRVDKIEELTSLSLLELQTTNFEVLDSAGVNRTKSGVVVDNFSTQQLSDTSNSHYYASIDPLGQNLRPSFHEDNIKLIYDSAASTNTIKKGDNVYLAHTEESYINQNLASKSIQINPFSVVVHEGVITLSPSSDEWRNTEYAAGKIIDGGVKLDTTQAYLWNNWSWNWGGLTRENLKAGSTTNAKVVTSGNTTTTAVNKVVSDEVVQKLIGDRVINVALLPYIRSRKIFFKAEGLRPNSKVFAFFDGTSVANWVRSENFAFHSDNLTDYGDIYNRATAHPEGASTLETDANGTITGSFFIPSTTAERFRTGTREFKILDISVDKNEDALSIARAIYVATGYLDTRQKEFMSTRVLTVEGSISSFTRPHHSGNNQDPDHDRTPPSGPKHSGGACIVGESYTGRPDDARGSNPYGGYGIEAGRFSDSRLKSNIVFSHMHDDLKVYGFNYIGETIRYLGVMAQDLLGTKYESAVSLSENGYYLVDYSLLPVDMETI